MKSLSLTVGGVVLGLAVLFPFASFGISPIAKSTTLVYLSPTGTSTYAVQVTNNTTALNVVEIELQFDPTAVILDVARIESDLCKSELVVQNTVDPIAGVWYFACGTYVPFTDTTAELATITVTPVGNRTSALTFGPKTHFYQHDGLGTQVTPLTVGFVLASR